MSYGMSLHVAFIRIEEHDVLRLRPGHVLISRGVTGILCAFLAFPSRAGNIVQMWPANIYHQGI